jgi:hypothetical protein
LSAGRGLDELLTKAVASSKGAVKTTTPVNLAVGLARAGSKVLLGAGACWRSAAGWCGRGLVLVELVEVVPRDVLDHDALGPWVVASTLRSARRRADCHQRPPREPLWTVSHHGGDVHGVAFSPDGKLLASAGADDQVVVMRAATGERVRRHGGDGGGFACVAFSADGGRYIAAHVKVGRAGASTTVG